MPILTLSKEVGMGMAYCTQTLRNPHIETAPHPRRLWLRAGVLAVCALTVACTSVPELRHPEGKGKQAIPGNMEAAARYEALRQGIPPPTEPLILSHDAADIRAMGDQIEQLKQQISVVRSLAPGDPGKTNPKSPEPLTASAKPAAQETPLLVSAGRRFEVHPKDTTVLGVIARWADLGHWHVQLNGLPLNPASFPSHAVAYVDIPLTQTSKGLGDDEIDAAIGALLQAHQHFSGSLSLSLSLKPSTRELEVSSQLLTDPSSR